MPCIEITGCQLALVIASQDTDGQHILGSGDNFAFMLKAHGASCGF